MVSLAIYVAMVSEPLCHTSDCKMLFKNILNTMNMYVLLIQKFFCNAILFAICTSTFSKLCMQWHVEDDSVARLCN
jgi:hypothetical protein